MLLMDVVLYAAGLMLLVVYCWSDVVGSANSTEMDMHSRRYRKMSTRLV